MNVSMAELRRTMYQRFDPNTVHLAPRTFYEESRSRAFESGDPSELFHENTKYVPGVMDRAMQSVAEFERRSMRYVEARIDQDYAGHGRIELPEPKPLSVELAEVLRSRRSRRRYGTTAVSAEELSDLLHYSAGVTATREVADRDLDDVHKRFRSYPSAGARYPVELYVVVLGCRDFDRGVYYYVPQRHELRVLEGETELDVDDVLVGTGGTVDIEGASVLVVLTGAFPRSTAKYGPRGYRYVLQESGHLAQNVQLVATALGLGSIPLGGFYDDSLNGVLGVDGIDEAALYAVVVGSEPERDREDG